MLAAKTKLPEWKMYNPINFIGGRHSMAKPSRGRGTRKVENRLIKRWLLVVISEVNFWEIHLENVTGLHLKKAF